MYVNRENPGFEVTNQALSQVRKSGLYWGTNRNQGKPPVTRSHVKGNSEVDCRPGGGATRETLSLDRRNVDKIMHVIGRRVFCSSLANVYCLLQMHRARWRICSK
jgi:hypothetical protein